MIPPKKLRTEPMGSTAVMEPDSTFLILKIIAKITLQNYFG